LVTSSATSWEHSNYFHIAKVNYVSFVRALRDDRALTVSANLARLLAILASPDLTFFLEVV